MGLIENPKTYTGRDLETIFFRPIMKGENAPELGIRMLYNMPVPTTIQLWSPQDGVLREYSKGWDGGESAYRKQKTIELKKVKAEVGFSASDYFNQVYELITGRADVNLDDLTGTELEQAETEMFRAAIAESLRVMVWLGDTDDAAYNLFDGFIKKAYKYGSNIVNMSDTEITADNVMELFNTMWTYADVRLKSLKSEGHLAFYVTSDVYEAYERYLDQFGTDGAYTDIVSGRRELMFHGIKIVDIRVSHLLPTDTYPHQSICILTDSRNLAMAVNTSDYPGSEVRMWYNPDEMENRQRATFMAGCEILDDDLLVVAKLM
ncbi:MAG: hypothetical protein IKB15_03510 [Alistipes sp.]|nr:hypothetical protein [Alistipes sp.]